MSSATQNGSDNKLLAGLPLEDAIYLASISRLERPAQGQALTGRSVPASEVWFPQSGVIALFASNGAGRSVQIGLVGNEGCVGLEALVDRVPRLTDAVVQIEGSMSVVSAAQLKATLFDRPSIEAAMARFLFGLCAQSVRTIACDRVHSLPSRCCRWLLKIQDRLGSDDLPLTQERLAALLGSGRQRINAVLGELEQDGLVRRDRGRVRLMTRSGLEARSCECYAAIPSANPLIRARLIT
jgi:CRP-like cAMP-binding protein